MINPFSDNARQGFTLITITISMAIILAFGLVLVTYVFNANRVSIYYSSEVSALQIAEAGMQKALFCLNATVGTNCGGSFGSAHVGETDVTFGAGKFTTQVIGAGSTKTVVVVGTDPTGREVTLRQEVSNIPPSDEPDFSFALQAGQGGIYMMNNSEVTGTVYTSGNIDCQGTNAIIDGDAYVSKAGGEINSCGVNYDAHADSILDSDVSGDAYYDSDASGSDIDGDEYPGSAAPTEKPLPDIDEAFWRASAEAGGTINGNYAPADGETLGPIRINGNLDLNNNVDIIVAGPIWVRGNLAMYNNSTMTLDSGFGEYGTVILADHPSDITKGKVYMVNGSGVFGTGNPTSHIMIASTNNSIDELDPALDIYNNAAGAIFLAETGVMNLHNNAGAKSMAAYRLYLENNAEVTYVESNLSDMKFSNSPSTTWHEVESTWRMP